MAFPFLKNSLAARVTLVVTLFAAETSVSACEWVYLIWIPRTSNADPLYRFIKGDKAGYIDQSGKVVIPPSLPWNGNFGGEFHDGLLNIGSLEGVYIDKTGKEIIDRRSKYGWDFSEGLTVVVEEGNSKIWGYMNTQGQFTIIPKFRGQLSDEVWSFENGLAKVQVNGLTGFIDHSGAFVIEPRFLDADSFHEDMAWVVAEGPCVYFRTDYPCPNIGVLPKEAKGQQDLPLCKYTFIDKSGRIISSRRFEYLGHFSEGLAPFRAGQKWGYIDKKGEVAIAPRFETAGHFSGGLASVSEDKLYGYIDRLGKYAIPPQYKYAGDFVDGRAVVGEPGARYWYIGHDGRQAFPGTFELASRFFEGLAHVKLLNALRIADAPFSEAEKYAYIDKNGKVVFSYAR